MKDSDPPDSDDDGWGEAADAAAAPASEAAIDNEWDDPADLEKRVAALRGQRDTKSAPSSANALTAAGTTTEPPAPSEIEPAAPSEIEPAAPSEIEPAAPSEIDPTSSPEIEPAAPAEIEPAAPSEIEAAAPPVIASATTWENTSPASRDELPLPTPSPNMRAAAGLGPNPQEPALKEPRKRKAKRADKDSTNAASSTKGPAAAPAGPLLTGRQKKFIVGGSIALILAAVCAVLGWFNSKNYYLSCGTRTITAAQGRFWPWGTNPLPGPAFKAIHVPTDVLCTNQHFESRKLVEEAFLAALLEQSTALLTSGDAEHVDTAEQQLEQALLLTRAPERSAQRALAQRLQGDVAYWRGAAQIQAAAELLQKGASHFEAAAAKRPRHTSDANAWAEHARFLESEIGKGPSALRKDDTPKEQPTFQGLSPNTAAPSSPSAGSPPDEAMPDAGVPSAPVDAAPAPSDAALPKGGVLL